MDISVLFIVFNRLNYTQKVFEQIKKVKPNRFYISCDGPRKNVENEDKIVSELRVWLLDNIDWDCEVKTRFLEENSGGCKYGVSEAISWFFSCEEEGIILEDDCVPDESFFPYCKELLEKYRDDKRIWQIAGSNLLPQLVFDTSYYFSKMPDCWGWATWKDRWKYFTLDVSDYDIHYLNNFTSNKNFKLLWEDILYKVDTGIISTWDYQWVLIIIKNNGLCIAPSKNLVMNIGEIGEHFSSNNEMLYKQVHSILPIIHPDNVIENYEDRKYYEEQANQNVASLKSKFTYKHWYEKIFSVKNLKVFPQKVLTIFGMVFYFDKKR